MNAISKFVLSFLAVTVSACGTGQSAQTVGPSNSAEKAVSAIPVADRFAYAVGPNETATQGRDKADQWYNALDFGANDHLGEDWNKNSGGNTDCGEPVYAVATGRIVFAGDAGPGWGNVLIVEHRLADGSRVQSLYGHLQKILKSEGDVKIREQIGEIGNANGRYYCHLHLEIRTSDSRDWNLAGGGYSKDRKGWVDPSDFIDAKRKN